MNPNSLTTNIITLKTKKSKQHEHIEEIHGSIHKVSDSTFKSSKRLSTSIDESDLDNNKVDNKSNEDFESIKDSEEDEEDVSSNNEQEIDEIERAFKLKNKESYIEQNTPEQSPP